MADKTGIEWTEATWNPWSGCERVSAGCDACYMFREKKRWGQDPLKVVRSKGTFFDPVLKWAKDPKLIFTCSFSDWFIEAADEFRHEAWDIVRATPQHQYQILTKRPQNVPGMLPHHWSGADFLDLENVWLGVSVENNKALRRIRYFSRFHKMGIRLPVYFVSFEPLLEEINLAALAEEFRLHPYQWAIIGGESGYKTGEFAARNCNLDWIDQLLQFHQQRGVPVFVKQTGTLAAERHGLPSAGTALDLLPERWQGLNVKDFPNFYHRWNQSRKNATLAPDLFNT